MSNTSGGWSCMGGGARSSGGRWGGRPWRGLTNIQGSHNHWASEHSHRSLCRYVGGEAAVSQKTAKTPSMTPEEQGKRNDIWLKFLWIMNGTKISTRTCHRTQEQVPTLNLWALWKEENGLNLLFVFFVEFFYPWVNVKWFFFLPGFCFFPVKQHFTLPHLAYFYLL